jgi:hypothetical protein
MCVRIYPVRKFVCTQDVTGVRSIFQDLIPELMLSQKCNTCMGPISNGSGDEFLNYIKKLQIK